MDEILEGLRAEAEGRFGPVRAGELGPTLEAMAAELAALRGFRLDAEDAP